VAKPNKVVDITGAGDTVSGALGIILASHQDAIKEAMRLSNDLAAISISHRGCYVPTRHQMKKIFGPYI
ncbi:MAG: hypothetical protein GWN01_13270, partial [Nitrosopumilaceae archaeon]|nr:carbohydrate kinase family protein [Nitrosopumilaceae archaeon]NIU88248.1 hypothetical protein [Nitrosopumilaceae archaeon]NIV66548.1 hypothetical protein [Nitrosopumilaceae archaeon]NIX62436.1 hypothetical protein [Nitrosopumilaceae archaeon]